MRDIGDLIIYPGHGICRVDDICDKEIAGTKKTYYILHPIEDNQNLTLNLPTDSSKIKMKSLINKDEAKKILDLFTSPSVDWIDKPTQRNQEYNSILKSGDRLTIAKLATTLLRKKLEMEKDDRKFFDHDNRLLLHIQTVLYKELAIALDTSTGEIEHMVNKLVSKSPL